MSQSTCIHESIVEECFKRAQSCMNWLDSCDSTAMLLYTQWHKFCIRMSKDRPLRLIGEQEWNSRCQNPAKYINNIYIYIYIFYIYTYIKLYFIHFSYEFHSRIARHFCWSLIASTVDDVRKFALFFIRYAYWKYHNSNTFFRI